MDVIGMVDPTVLIGCLTTMGVAAVVAMIMRYSYASQEAQYSQHISTLYGSAKSKAAKAEKKKKDENESDDSYDDVEAKQARALLAKSATTAASNEYGHHHVAIDPEPVVLGEGSDDSSKQKNPRPKPRKRQLSKSILHNKDEASLVQSGEVESRTEFTSSTIPVDEVELLHRRNSEHEASPDGAAAEEVVEEVVVPASASNQKAASPQLANQVESNAADVMESSPSSSPESPRKGSQKDKRPQPSSAASGLDKLLVSISQSELSQAEMEKLVEQLITRHCGSVWERKAAVEDATNQMKALQSALDSEKTTVAWTNEKLQETSNKLSLAERNHMAANGQIQEMQKRLQQLHEQHRAEVQGIQQARLQEIGRIQQHAQQQAQQQLQLLREENQTLRKALPKTDEVGQMRSQLRAVEGELKDQQRHVASIEAKNKDLNSRLTSAQERYRQENMQCVEMQNRLDELTYAHSRQEKQLTDTQTRAHAAENDLRNLQDHLRAKDVEIKELHSEILEAKQTANETISTTSEEDNKKILQLESSLSALKELLASKQRELENVHTQLSQAKIDLEHANEAKPQANGVAGHGDSSNGHDKICELEDCVSHLQAEVDSLKTKNNELRKKNWSMTEALEKAETTASSVHLLESELEQKSSTVHDLKALNQTLTQQNSELQGRLDQVTTTSTRSENLRQELKVVRQSLDEKDDMIHNLEHCLAEEREKLTAMEQECKHLLEHELHKSVAAIEDHHKSTINDLQSSLDQSEMRITDLESLLHQSNARINQMGQDSLARVEELEAELKQADQELKVQIEAFNTLKKLHRNDDEGEKLTVYYNAEIKAPQAAADEGFFTDVNENNNNSVTVKLVPVYEDLDISRAELRQRLLATERELDRYQLKVSSEKSSVVSLLKQLEPAMFIDPDMSLKKSVESFHEHTVSRLQLRAGADSQYKQALIQADEMLDRLSQTLGDKLNEKEQQISRLESEVQRYQSQQHSPAVAAMETSTDESSSSELSGNADQAMQLAHDGSLQDFSSTV